MSLSPEEHDAIRTAVYEEMADFQRRLSHDAGSFNYVCMVGGGPTFTHNPVGAVLHTIPHLNL